MEVSVLSVGGTFEKAYSTDRGTHDFEFPVQSNVLSIAERIRISHILDVTYEQGQAKDSLDMTDEDRQEVVNWCLEVENTQLVVVHGTDTMIETAAAIAKAIDSDEGVHKTVILTGASQPACVTGTDAEFNLGGAIALAQGMPYGVYLFVSGRFFRWDKCEKAPSGVFHEKRS